ncbi:MAG: aminotransferase class III-fold pyridoxal phosphate-dependent enzyme [Hyphomicrobiaceae bacterium]
MSAAAAQTSATYEDLLERANAHMPAGSFGNLPAEIIIAEGHGARVTDVAGRSYIDYLLGSGPMFIGHAHPHVVEAVTAQVAKGSTFFANSAPGIRLAEAISAAVPCAEKVRFTSSGTEATHFAMRLARAYRGRDKIMKFEGGFHGMGDWALMSMAPKSPGNFPQAIPDSPGIPQVLTGEMLIAPFNDADAATQMIEANADQLAGVIVEPQQRLIPPKPGFLAALREATAKHGIPLILDEIVTGFRHAYGGAQEYYGVVPDMCALGKIVGGGYPLAAVAGRDEIMKHLDKGRVGEAGYVQQTGTLSGNPIAAAAGLATLEVLQAPGTYEKVHETGRTLMTALAGILAKQGITAQVVGEPIMFEVFFTGRPIHNYRDLLTADAGKLTRFNALLMERGILKSGVKYYVSTAHGPAEVAETIAAWESAAKAL